MQRWNWVVCVGGLLVLADGCRWEPAHEDGPVIDADDRGRDASAHDREDDALDLDTAGSRSSGARRSADRSERASSLVAPPTCGSMQSLENITEPTRLREGGCYRVAQSLQVRSRLEIEPGVTIELDTGAAITITEQGSIVAAGTADAPITFTGTLKERGHWKALNIASNEPANELSFVHFAYGARESVCCANGREPAMVLISGDGRATITHSVFAHSAHNALTVEANAQIDRFEDNQFIDNAGAPVRAAVSRAGFLDGGSDYQGDAEKPHGAPYLELYGNLDSPLTLHATNLPYRAPGNVRVNGGLTLEPGVRIEFSRGGGLEVAEQGFLHAVGTQDEPILLTGEFKDELGTWMGVFIGSEARENQLSFVEIAFGGEKEWCCASDRLSSAGLTIDPEAHVSIQDSTFRQNEGYGIHAVLGSVVTAFARNTFVDNQLDPVLIPASSATWLDVESDYGQAEGTHVQLFGTTLNDRETWPAIATPYLVTRGNVDVAAALTIADGARIHFAEDRGLWVQASGSLTAVGDVVFSSASGLASQWLGIGFASSSQDNVLDGVTVDGAGSASWCCMTGRQRAAVLADPMSHVTVANSTLTRSGGYGIFAVGDAVVDEMNNSLSENAQ